MPSNLAATEMVPTRRESSSLWLSFQKQIARLKWRSRQCMDANLLRGPLRYHAPDQQYDNRAHDGADQARVLARLVPADRLAEVSRDERADDAEDRRQYESGRLILPRM